MPFSDELLGREAQAKDSTVSSETSANLECSFSDSERSLYFVALPPAFAYVLVGSPSPYLAITLSQAMRCACVIAHGQCLFYCKVKIATMNKKGEKNQREHQTISHSLTCIYQTHPMRLQAAILSKVIHHYTDLQNVYEAAPYNNTLPTGCARSTCDMLMRSLPTILVTINPE